MVQKIENAKYLSDVYDFIPEDVILNKGITGCGGTHLELNSKRNSILSVRTIVSNG